MAFTRGTLILSIVILILIHGFPAFAQSGALAQLDGTVKDPSGAVVPNVIVTSRNLETDQLLTVSTSGDGQYIFSSLPPGVYQITAEAQGFTPLRYDRIELAVGQKATIHVQLEVAGAKSVVVVTASTPLIEPARTEQSQVIEEMHIQNLPINGRQFLDFVLLTPNVDTGRTNIANQYLPGEPSQVDLSFVGLQETASLVTVDSADNMARQFGRSRSTPSQEAVREFRVVANSPMPDQGPSAGGVINIVTKSGTNSPQGSAYYYLRNDALDARNMLAQPGFDELRQNQFGVTSGGPLIKNTAFVFANYEGQRRRESPFYSSTLLSNLAAINAIKQSLGLSSEVLAGKIRKTDYDSVFLRNDFKSHKHLVGATYRLYDNRGTNVGAATGQLSAPSNFRDITIRDQALALNMITNLSSKLSNQALFQFARHRFDFPSVSYEPHLQIVNTLDLGRHANSVDATRETRFELGDSLTYITGTHNLKFGGDIYRINHSIHLDSADPANALFPNLDAFLGKPPFGQVPFAVTFLFMAGPDWTRPQATPGFTKATNTPWDSMQRYRSETVHLGLFAQDQWRPLPNLTLNYGLRYDLDLMPQEFFQHYYKAFQPRFGLTYSMLSDRMVLRAGAGVYQGVQEADAYQFSRIIAQDPALGTVNSSYSSIAGMPHTIMISDPMVAIPALLKFTHTGIYPTPDAGKAPYQTFFLSTNKTNSRGVYSYQWSAQLDCSLSPNLVLTMGYSGVRGLNLQSSVALNVAPAVLKLANGKSDYAIAPGVPVARVVNPAVSPMALFSDNVGQSNYHAGTLTIVKRFSRHYAFSANYTWSKAIDNSGSVAIVDFPEDPYRRDLERSLSKQHVPHRFVGSFTAEGPLSSRWLRNLHIAVIPSIESARRYTLYAGLDANNDGNPMSDRVGTLGRNTYKGDSHFNFDLRLARSFRISERIKSEFIAEAFNLLNTLNVTDVNTVYGSPALIGSVPQYFGDRAPAPLPGLGSIRAIAPPRQIQFALKFAF
jgi:hypothetical protein